jgi:hypothetical protein
MSLLYAPSALAQSQQHTLLGDKKACYNQAQAYVATQNQNSVALPGKPWAKTSYSFGQAHYDAKAQVCFVLMNTSMPVFPPDSTYHSQVEQVIVDDAFEGKRIAIYTAAWSMDQRGEMTHGEPTNCEVEAKRCSARPEFNRLLWKLIPAFQPTNCFAEQNGKREPCKKAAN